MLSEVNPRQNPSCKPPSRREARVEAIAMIVREQTRWPSGTPMISPQKARDLGEYIYQYLQTEKVILP